MEEQYILPNKIVRIIITTNPTALIESIAINFRTDGTNCKNKILLELLGEIVPYISISKKVVVIKKIRETTILIFRRRELFIQSQNYAFYIQSA